jgi:glutaredoxin 3
MIIPFNIIKLSLINFLLHTSVFNRYSRYKNIWINNMSKIEIYTSPFCGYCYAAKNLLREKNTLFTEIDLSLSPEKRQEMINRSFGVYTVPQIFINEIHIGGYNEIAALEQIGRLDALLQK